MSKIKIEISSLDPPKKIQKGREIVIKMTNNKNFATPIPDLKVVSTCINEFESSYEAALDGGRTLKQIMYNKEKQFDLIFVQLAGYVESVAGGDEQKILSSGFEVRNPSTPGKRTDVVKAGNLPGEVIVNAMLEPGEKTILHIWQYCIGAVPLDVDDKSKSANGWIEIDETSKANITIKGLTSGLKIWVRHQSFLSKGRKTAWRILGSVTVP